MTQVDFVAEKEQFEVSYRANAPMGEEFRKAVMEVIIFPGVRKFLGNVGGVLHNSPEQGP